MAICRYAKTKGRPNTAPYADDPVVISLVKITKLPNHICARWLPIFNRTRKPNVDSSHVTAAATSGFDTTGITAQGGADRFFTTGASGPNAPSCRMGFLFSPSYALVM
jgi:hypothetical protein